MTSHFKDFIPKTNHIICTTKHSEDPLNLHLLQLQFLHKLNHQPIILRRELLCGDEWLDGVDKCEQGGVGLLELLDEGVAQQVLCRWPV